MEKKLLLFDIDGTLLTSGGAGERALRRGFRDRFGIEDDLGRIEIAGRTDSGIARQMLAYHGLPETPENLTAFFDGYLHFLAEELPSSPGTLLPGILPLLEALKPRTDIVLALLTGNLARGAEIKLTHYGVWHYFEFGAYADDHHDRNQLGHFARQRALEKHGVEFPPARIYVLGDTPHDISCARAIGAKAVAIATGKFTVGELGGLSPDFLFTDLSDVPAVLKIFR
ncbi:MAG: HAD family hydrolase [Chthoniobacter sp.]|uniref:HAD family hydrolase n=1 Tax=Chthoniobacter sp. TaxID=2510640 RepID=UPI0032A886AC